MAIVSLTQLKELLRYDPETGRMYWRATEKRAGTLHRLGYRNVVIRGKTFAEHRVAWCLMTGNWPLHDVDHINRVRDDNRFCNLRLATRAENCQNQPVRRSNRSGVTGVYWHRRANKWVAAINLNGKLTHLGTFDDFIDAVQVRRASEAKHYPFRPV